MQKATHTHSSDIELFSSALREYRTRIDVRIDDYCRQLETQTAELYGDIPLEVFKTFTDYLKRGGKRFRGALTMVGYELAGGTDEDMIIEAALAIEMLQAYILMMDDIQDRSDTRRGGPSAHVMLRHFHEQHHFHDDAQHFGESMAMNAYMIGCHSALDVILGLNVPAERRIKATHNIHNCYITTGHGQTMDVYNEVSATTDSRAVENVMTWKTAYYTFVNPLQLGAILAGGDETLLASLHDYSLPAGRAFQITDDIIGIFGDEVESGKSPLDDLREGKRTLLTLKALEIAPKADAYYLETCLGKQDVTMAEFLRCREIIADSGALEFARQEAQSSVRSATSALERLPVDESHKGLAFLRGLTAYLLQRNS